MSVLAQTAQPTADPFASSLIAPPEDEALIAPDAHVIAKNIVDAKKRKNKSAPSEIDLAESITEIALTSQMPVPTIVVTVQDPEWAILDSGIFDTDENSQIDPIDVNYPDRSRYWWRLTQISPVPSAHQINLTFMTREAVYLMHLLGPVKANRAKMTRAEFLKMLVSRVKEGKIEFYSKELDVKEPIDPVQSGTGASSSMPSGSAAKVGGIGANASGLTAKGAPLTSSQLAAANHLLQVAQQLNAGDLAATAMIFAAIWESGLTEGDPTNSSGYGGILAGSAAVYSNGDTAGQAKGFLQGDGHRSFQGPGVGGAIAAVQSGLTNPVEIAVRVEVPSIWPSNAYASESGYPGDTAAAAEAQKIVQAAGGAGGGLSGPGGGASSTVTTVQAYFFEVNPNETFYDAMIRLAQEVNWALFFDGNRVYYDSEPELIKQKVAAVIHRDDRALIDWPYDWDTRQIASNAVLTLIAGMFELHTGEVLKLEGMGAASTGSSVKPAQPGRWLIDNITRNKSDIVSQVTLRQPTLPKREPAPQISTTTVAGSGPGGGGTTPSGGVAAPFKGTTGRLDMGIDGDATEFDALYNGTFHIAARSGWPGEGTYCAIVNDDQSGPDYTRAVYYAEGMRPILADGTKVVAGQKIGEPVASGGTGAPGNFEIGPANTTDFEPLAKTYGLGSAGARSMVLSFYNWVRTAGIPPASSTDNAGSA